MSDLYLYESPFIYSGAKTYDYTLEVVSAEDKEDEEKILAHLLSFAVEHKLIERSTSGEVTRSLDTNTGSWIWIINWTNFRSLVVKTRYQTIMSALQSNDDMPINQILDLHVQLGSLYDTKLLNTICNRVMNAIQLVPYGNDEDDQLTWKTIHTETPFLWIVILLQIVIRVNVK